MKEKGDEEEEEENRAGGLRNDCSNSSRMAPPAPSSFPRGVGRWGVGGVEVEERELFVDQLIKNNIKKQ